MLKKKETRELIENKRIIEDETINMDNLNSKIEDMQKLIYKETHDKLYFPMIDKIVKFQKLCRRNLLLFRMRKMIHKLVLITRLYKHFDKYEIR